jgi:hypothetical protein
VRSITPAYPDTRWPAQCAAVKLAWLTLAEGAGRVQRAPYANTRTHRKAPSQLLQLCLIQRATALQPQILQSQDKHLAGYLRNQVCVSRCHSANGNGKQAPAEPAACGAAQTQRRSQLLNRCSIVVAEQWSSPKPCSPASCRRCRDAPVGDLNTRRLCRCGSYSSDAQHVAMGTRGSVDWLSQLPSPLIRANNGCCDLLGDQLFAYGSGSSVVVAEVRTGRVRFAPSS